MKSFQFSDAWGFAGATLVLVFVYLILRDNGMPFSNVVSAGGSAYGNLITKLQGRG